MTESRNPDRLIRAWLDLMPGEAPDRVVSAVLQAAEAMPQLRPTPWQALRRPDPMNRLLISLAAAAVVVVAAGTLLLTKPTANVAAPTSRPSPTSSQPTADPTASLPITPAAQRIWGDWVADANLGLPAQGPRIQMSINWDGGRDVWIQTNYDTGTQVFRSDSVSAGPDQLRLVAQDASGGCTRGDVGTYGWDRSPDGEFLTLTRIDDQCPARGAAFARTWVHTLSAVTDGGRGVLPVDNLEVTLPNVRMGLGGRANAADVTTTFTGGPFIEFLAMRDPDRFGEPCSTTDRKPTLGSVKASDAIAYVRSLPGFTWEASAATIDQNAATHLMGTPRPGFTCAAGDIGLFPFISGSGGGADWTIAPGKSLSVWVTEAAGHAWLFWYHGDEIAPSDEAAVIASVRFITALPTP